MPKSKFVRVAVEGGTTDGRIIEKNWLTEMAETYKPATYGARINMEHIKGFSPQPPFNAYGDVLALKTEEIDLEVGGKTEKRLALYAELDVTDQLVTLNQQRQKIYTSIEIEPNFRGTGKCYLMGLAVTDNPASLGTEALQFAALKPVFESRKTNATCMFSSSLETKLELADTPAAPANPAASFFDQLSAALGFTKSAPTAVVAPTAPAPAAGGGFTAEQGAALMGMFNALRTDLDASRKTDFATLQGEFKTAIGAIDAKLDGKPGFTKTEARPAATGGAGEVLTDC